MTAYTMAGSTRKTIPNRDKHNFGLERGMVMCIYRITHKTSGLIYIGQSVNAVGGRWLNHLYKSGDKNSRIKRSLLKYGRNEFIFDVIDIAETQKQLDHKEKFWIDFLNTISPNGFNLKSGGRGGNKLSVESIEKMRATKKSKRPIGFISKEEQRKLRTQEEKDAARAAANAARKGKPTWLSTAERTPEMIEKMRIAKTGVPVPKKYKPVIRSDGVEFESIGAAAIALGCDRRLITQSLSKRKCRAHGYYFSYKEQTE